jgi:hypothetical protein
MLTPLDLNLATRPFRNNVVPWVGLLLGVVLVGSLTYWNVSRFVEYGGMLGDLRQTLQTYDQQMDDLDSRDIRARQGIKTHDIGVLEVQSEKANDVIQLKAFSWTRLFNQLESVMPLEVRMQSVHPMFRFGDRTRTRVELEGEGVPVTVEGVARTRPALWEFQGNLLKDPHFDRIEPEWDLPSDKKEIIFKLRFRYYPYTEEEAAGEATTEEAAATEDAAGTPGKGTEEGDGEAGGVTAKGEEAIAQSPVDPDGPEAPAAARQGPAAGAGGGGR